MGMGWDLLAKEGVGRLRMAFAFQFCHGLNLKLWDFMAE